MINLTHTQFTPHQGVTSSDTEYDMNALAKRYNAETKSLTAGTGKKVIIRKRVARSYRPILN